MSYESSQQLMKTMSSKFVNLCLPTSPARKKMSTSNLNRSCMKDSIQLLISKQRGFHHSRNLLIIRSMSPENQLITFLEVITRRKGTNCSMQISIVRKKRSLTLIQRRCLLWPLRQILIGILMQVHFSSIIKSRLHLDVCILLHLTMNIWKYIGGH